MLINDMMYHSLEDFQASLFLKTGSETARPNQPLKLGETPLNKLRSKLINEEGNELAEAILEDDEAHILKEFADVFYVVYGSMVCYAITPELMAKVFIKVHENNMLKLQNSKLNDLGKFVKPKDHPPVDLTEEVRQWRNFNKHLTEYRNAL